MQQTTQNQMARIDPTMSSQAKTGGIFGYALTMGIASMSVKVAIAGDAAEPAMNPPDQGKSHRLADSGPRPRTS